jgi:uncharacterized protein (DUF305 family)
MHPGSTRIQRTGIVLVVTLGSACSGASVGRSSAPQPMTRAQSDMAAIAKARADSTRLPYTEADIHFMSGMIAHHSQAILMAKWAPTHGANPTLFALTERIINAQQDEITLMQRWLRDRNQPVPSGAPGPMKMKMGGMEHDMLMPGMLTDDQLKELDAARGTEFDRLFLTFMIQHHRGAVSMVKDLFATYGAGQDETVFKFASDVNVDQTTEIARMQKMLMAVVLGTPAP